VVDRSGRIGPSAALLHEVWHPQTAVTRQGSVVIAEETTVQVWPAGEGKVRDAFKTAARIDHLAALQGDRLAIATEQGIEVRNAGRREARWVLVSESPRDRRIAVSADGTHLFADTAGQLLGWDIPSLTGAPSAAAAKPRWTSKGNTPSLSILAVSSDGARL